MSTSDDEAYIDIDGIDDDEADRRWEAIDGEAHLRWEARQNAAAIEQGYRSLDHALEAHDGPRARVQR